jgi:hypothetical protein
VGSAVAKETTIVSRHFAVLDIPHLKARFDNDAIHFRARHHNRIARINLNSAAAIPSLSFLHWQNSLRTAFTAAAALAAADGLAGPAHAAPTFGCKTTTGLCSRSSKISRRAHLPAQPPHSDPLYLLFHATSSNSMTPFYSASSTLTGLTFRF